MKIHVISDTHLESYGLWEVKHAPLPTVEADVCILAGDICTVLHFEKYEIYINRLKEQFKHIIFIAGNHEFYGSHYDETISRLQELASRTGTHFLDIETNPSVIIDGVTFWGSTLWTDFGDGKYEFDVHYALNDYRLILDIDTDKIKAIHDKTVEMINWDADVVITHHMPVLREHRKYPIGPITYGFCCTDLEDKIAKSKIKKWIYGHTHDNQQVNVNGVEIITNQVGYFLEHMISGYDSEFIVEV